MSELSQLLVSPAEKTPLVKLLFGGFFRGVIVAAIGLNSVDGWDQTWRRVAAAGKDGLTGSWRCRNSRIPCTFHSAALSFRQMDNEYGEKS